MLFWHFIKSNGKMEKKPCFFRQSVRRVRCFSAMYRMIKINDKIKEN